MSKVILVAPLAGWSTPLDEAPDAVFAGRMLGDGLAIDPTGRFVYVGNEARGITVYSRCSDGSLTVESKLERDLSPTFAFATLP